MQSPLQPLKDNLSSSVYEVFEQDPIKYKLYEDALHQAILAIPSDQLMLLVLGAGRGPLIDRAIKAAESAGKCVKIYGVEKNKSALIYLAARKVNEEDWKNVTIIEADMRDWSPEFKADIVVSELLGSFGDNELSPECIDGVQKLLKPEGVQIPHSYASWVVPITSQKLYNAVENLGKEKRFEMPYVVKIRQALALSESLKVWEFQHVWSNSQGKGNSHNNREGRVVFTNTIGDCIIHGFASYFTCVLFGNVVLSTVPSSHSPGMFSWFPMFFPIESPISSKAGAKLELAIYRKTNPSKMWYEWAMIPTDSLISKSSKIHNANGDSYSVYLH